jgi:thiosulfate dehydrogenase [quinone] large subunit
MASGFGRNGTVVKDPPLARFLLNDKRAAWLWLIPRVWLGWQWIQASMHKIGDPAWVSTGTALKGFWANAVAIPQTGHPAITYEWYRTFLQGLLNAQAYTWFAKVVAYGEMTIGVLLILGAFTGIAAFMGGFMNWNFMMAGSASVNPVYFVIAVGLILAWKVSGFVGADYVLLPALGTPWGRQKAAAAVPAPAPAAGD